MKELDTLGLSPANLPELLAFGETHPEVQRQFTIIALGSVWQRSIGCRYVPCLDGSGDGGRLLCLGRVEVDWSDYCGFATVRK